MTSRSKISLVLLAAAAVAWLVLVVLREGDSDVPDSTNDLTADERPGGPDDPNRTGLTGSGETSRPDGGVRVGPGGRPSGDGNLVGSRVPEGIDLSRPETREAELRKLLTAVPVDDWRAVARIVALMPANEPIPDELRPILLNELRSGRQLQVMHVFAKLNDASFVEDLFEVLESGEASKGHRRVALEALWKMPGGDDGAIARRLESSLTGDTAKDGGMLRAIGKRGGQEAARALVEYLQRAKNPSDVRLHILQSLDVSTDQAAAEIVKEALQTEASPKVQRALITMVMRPGASAMTEPLMALDRDGVADDVRSLALKALGRIADPKAAAYLIKKSGEPGVFGEQALAAVARLESADPRVGDLLATALADADRNPRPARAKASLLEALGAARHAPSLPTVARSLNDRDPAVQSAAIRAMGRMGSKAEEYVGRIGALFDRGDARKQQRVAIALADIGGTTAIAEIRRLLQGKDLNPSVKRTLQMGLRNAEDRLPKAPR